MSLQFVRDWFSRNFSSPQAVILALSLVVGLLFVLFLGDILAPVFAAVVIAYLLEGLVGYLERSRVPRLLAVILVFLMFLTGFIFAVVALFPMLMAQITQFLQSLPAMITEVQDALMRLPERYPALLSEEQIRDMIVVSREEIRLLGQRAVSFSVASLAGLVNVLIYLFLVPFLVFFMLKDKERIQHWLGRLLPRNRQLVISVWQDVDHQIGNYLRGKFFEILIVWGFSSATFALLGLEFAVLIGLLVGISVLVPYVGAVFMSIPVALAASFQWGFGSEFLYVMLAYVVIQVIDGNVLAPLLLSEVTDLHPVAIISAVLLFGGVWGFWGVVFAIPLATLVRAVIDAWPRVREGPSEPRASEREPVAEESL